MGESVPPSETALDRRLIQFNHLPKRLRAVGADKVFRFENWRERRDSDYFGSAARAAFNAASAPAEMPVPPTSRYFQPSLIRFSTSLAFTRIPHGTLCARHDFKQACNAASRSGEFMDTPMDMLRSAAAPGKIMPTPGTEAISSIFLRPSTDSIMMMASRSPRGFSGQRSARCWYSAELTPQNQRALPGL